ncbi:DUF3307 domain-containing protein [Actinomadura logoneensis]|uniref:DUF3307 domain-containing protein n=2 Tax=Actinomadura logoneensis TaxID=2293572 RepID=A0A372JSS1_9ACTN|nr:DUF3307 domain-containing protein [Actinomadura logoneensis]
MTPTTLEHTVTFAAVLPTLIIGHHLGDYWIQTDHQAKTKGAPGAPGRHACAQHVATLTMTLTLALVALAGVTGLHLPHTQVAIALMVNAASHYWADRRTTLAALARRAGKGAWIESDKAALPHLDQAWHLYWLGITALIIAS